MVHTTRSETLTIFTVEHLLAQGVWMLWMGVINVASTATPALLQSIFMEKIRGGGDFWAVNMGEAYSLNYNSAPTRVILFQLLCKWWKYCPPDYTIQFDFQAKDSTKSETTIEVLIIYKPDC